MRGEAIHRLPQRKGRTMYKLFMHQHGGSTGRRHVAAALALAAASLGLVAVTGTAATAGRPATVR